MSAGHRLRLQIKSWGIIDKSNQILDADLFFIEINYAVYISALDDSTKLERICQLNWNQVKSVGIPLALFKNWEM